MFCKNCGFEISNEALFCKKCGSKIEPILNKPVSVEEKANEKKGKKIIVNILIYLIETLFIFGNFIGNLIWLAVLSFTVDLEGSMTTVQENICLALFAIASFIPTLFLVLFCIAIIYVCIKKNTKFLIKYMIPYVVIYGGSLIINISKDSDFSTEAVIRAVLPLVLAVVIKAIVNAIQKKKQLSGTQ